MEKAYRSAKGVMWEGDINHDSQGLRYVQDRCENQFELLIVGEDPQQEDTQKSCIHVAKPDVRATETPRTCVAGTAVNDAVAPRTLRRTIKKLAYVEEHQEFDC